MPREKFQALTEQMFYILLCLKEECCGTDIMARVEEMTRGRVRVGPGTLYNLLEQFCEADFICQTKVHRRRRSYILTPRGAEVLAEEARRICAQIADYAAVFGEEEAT